MAVVTELITRFGFEGSLDPLQSYNSSLGKGIGLLAGLAAGLGVAVLGVGKFVTGISQSLQPLIDLNAQTGVSVEKIQELSFIAEQSSSSSEALFSSLSGLSAKVGEAAQKGSEDFSRLGISVRDANGQVKSTDSVLAEVSSRFKQLGLSMSEQQGFAEALGIDPSLLSMLNKTGSEMAALREESQLLGVLTTKQVKSAEDYNESLSKLGFGMQSVKRFIAVGLAPELTEMANDFTSLLASNKDFIINGITATVGILRDLVDALIRVAPFIAAVGAAFLLAKVYTLGFAGSLALVFSPAILIAAGIAAVIVVLDDLIVAFQGGNSVIRNFFLEFLGFDIRPVLQGIADVFGKLVSGISGGAKIIFDLLEPFSGLIAGVAAAFAVAAAGPAIFAGALALITSPVTLIVAGIAGILFAVDDLSKALSGGQSVIADFFQEFLGFDIQPVLVDIIDGFKEVFSLVLGLATGFLATFGGIFSGIGKLMTGNFSEGIADLTDSFSIFVDTIAIAFENVFGAAFDSIKQMALSILPDWAVSLIGGAAEGVGNATESVGNLASEAGGAISGLFGGATDAISGLFGGGESTMPMAQSSQVFQPGGGRANNLAQSSTVEQNVTMDIRTSDPERAGKAASDGLQRQLEDARNQTVGRGGS
jgi:hypothetical protein